jgi:hypothetical protein
MARHWVRTNEDRANARLTRSVLALGAAKAPLNEGAGTL